jgi:tRNA(Ile)-lysidine synthase
MTALMGTVVWVGGGLSASRAALREAQPADARHFLSAALVCAAGTTRPPRGEALDALLARLRKSAPVDATLAGARVWARDDEILIGRDTGRDGLPPLALEPGGVSVWDGRFELTVTTPGHAVVAARGLMARLSAPDRKQLQGLPPLLRASQPVIVDAATGDSDVRPVLAERIASVRALAGPRLLAACGQIAHEGEIGTGVVAPDVRSPYVDQERP